jgi:hypothetical protein
MSYPGPFPEQVDIYLRNHQCPKLIQTEILSASGSYTADRVMRYGVQKNDYGSPIS